jgi:hypothetical protein
MGLHGTLARWRAIVCGPTNAYGGTEAAGRFEPNAPGKDSSPLPPWDPGFPGVFLRLQQIAVRDRMTSAARLLDIRRPDRTWLGSKRQPVILASSSVVPRQRL